VGARRAAGQDQDVGGGRGGQRRGVGYDADVSRAAGRELERRWSLFWQFVYGDGLGARVAYVAYASCRFMPQDCVSMPARTRMSYVVTNSVSSLPSAMRMSAEGMADRDG